MEYRASVGSQDIAFFPSVSLSLIVFCSTSNGKPNVISVNRIRTNSVNCVGRTVSRLTNDLYGIDAVTFRLPLF